MEDGLTKLTDVANAVEKLKKCAAEVKTFEVLFKLPLDVVLLTSFRISVSLPRSLSLYGRNVS